MTNINHEAVTVDVVVVVRRNAGKSRAIDAVQDLPGDLVAIGGFRRTVFTPPGDAGDAELRQIANMAVSGAHDVFKRIKRASKAAQA